jgi:hypothetical protein
MVAEIVHTVVCTRRHRDAGPDRIHATSRAIESGTPLVARGGMFRTPRSRAVQPGWLAAIAIAAASCAITADPQPALHTTTSALATTVSLSPASDLANDHVWGGGGTAPIFALVDDGQTFAAANDNDFARSAPGVASAAITFGYAGAPAGGASQVVVNHRAWALSGAVGSVQVKLYNGATLLATGPAHALAATKTNFSDRFPGLAVSDANQLRTELDFTNTSGGSTSLGDTLVWIDVTPIPVSHELLHAAYPDAFVSNATGLPVRLNGFNLRATGSGGWAVPAAHFTDIKAKGFNMMRLAMSWNDYEPARGQFAASALAALDQTIASCKAAGIYVILDPIHANSGPKFPPWAVQASDSEDFQTVGREAIPYLQLIASRYANEPQVVAIDLLNEPQLHAIDSATLFGGYNALMAAVRPLVPNKILIVEPISGNVDSRKLDFSLLTDKTNVIYSLHYYYAGGDDDGYSTAGWATAGNFTWDGTSGYPVRNPAQLAAHLAVTLDVMQSVRMPVWIGEYGIGTGAQQHDAWFEDVVALFDAHGLSRTLWEYHWSTMSAVDNNYAWYPWVPLLLQ